MDAALDTLLTALYVKIDDMLVKDRRPGHPVRLSQSELVCLAVAQALLGFHSEHRWLRFAICHLRGHFPYLPNQPGYNKRLRAVLPLVKQVIRELAADSDFWFDDVWIADSTSVECGRSRPTVQRSDMAGWAATHAASPPALLGTRIDHLVRKKSAVLADRAPGPPPAPARS